MGNKLQGFWKETYFVRALEKQIRAALQTSLGPRLKAARLRTGGLYGARDAMGPCAAKAEGEAAAWDAGRAGAAPGERAARRAGGEEPPTPGFGSSSPAAAVVGVDLAAAKGELGPPQGLNTHRYLNSLQSPSSCKSAI